MENYKPQLESHTIAKFMLEILTTLPPLAAAKVVKESAEKALVQHRGWGIYDFVFKTNHEKQSGLDRVIDDMNKTINTSDLQQQQEKEKMSIICKAIKEIAELGHFNQDGTLLQFSSFNTKFIKALWEVLKLKILPNEFNVLDVINAGINEKQDPSVIQQNQLRQKLLKYESYNAFNAGSVAKEIYEDFASQAEKAGYLFKEAYNIIEKQEAPKM
ncbi:hypothetical protein [Facilibium subflavum]|uniref:hypothetical protein n=1 Tax=Facilibium subflavum TaxID=2219058 RepID=UPI000E64FE90|nr:hypothetical protein [Facilibium subflavum]